MLSAVLLVLATVVGCGGSGKPAISADEIVQNALAAQAAVAISHMQTSVQASLTGTMEGSAINVSLSGQLSGDIDWGNRKAKSHSELTGTYNGMPVTLGAEAYAVDNYSYSQVTFYGTAENWTRTELSGNYWSTETYTQLMYGLLPYADPEREGDEQVGGVDCYVLKLTPNYPEIQENLAGQYPQLASIPDLGSLFDHLSILVWVAQDTSFVTRIEIVAAAHATPQDLGEADNGDSVTASLTLTAEATKINQPVTITVPPEALNATG